MPVLVVSLLWLGMLIGVSFIATPVKFVVHDLTLPLALQIGQATFALFARVEWGFALVLMTAGMANWRTRPLTLALCAFIGALVAIQAVWLLPALDARVAVIVAGGAPPPSPHHLAYASVEAAKAIVLATLAALSVRSQVPQWARRQPIDA